MKRIGHLYEAIYEIENIKLAIRKASLGKRHHKEIKNILENIDAYALKIHRLLKNKTYKPSPYAVATIKDGANQKERTISKPKFYPDQIIHWSLMLVIEPVFMKGMYRYNCGSVPGRGSSFGQKSMRKWISNDSKNTKYCLKMDVSKFYPSVKNEILKASMRTKIKDNDALWLIDSIIDSAEGLPIGNYTSQWFANFFLTKLDHHIKTLDGAIYYIRYVDDLVVLGPNKKKLHKARLEIVKHLNSIGLDMKNNWQVFKIDSRPVDFLGVKLYRNHTTLRRRNYLRIKRRLKRIGSKPKPTLKDCSAVISYWGWIKRTDSYNFYHKHVTPYMTIAECREVVSRHGKINSARRRAGV